jgi:hypothetical protein
MDLRHQKRELLKRTGAREDHDRTPVPSQTRQLGMALLAPWLISAELFPARAVEGRARPNGIVSRVELPWALKSNSSFAERLKHYGSGRGTPRACRRRVSPIGESKQNYSRSTVQDKMA